MSFIHANAKALSQGSIPHGERAFPANISPPVLGVSGDEVVMGSMRGNINFLTPGEGTASVVERVVDSVKEISLE